MQRVCNRLHNPVHVDDDIVVPEPQDAIAVNVKPTVAGSIPTAFRVLPTVQLDDHAAVAADQIDDVRSDRFLANELHSMNGSRTEAVPKLLFCNG